ncbi:hypothetical protein [Oryzicola mucosus]|uniref:Uncharacterized protein n=1 Tax=Oryzicola mucosus TaxID=2767425 RepID=A0A8J6U5J0_9HYPH|nr:hypothetical protein [Oryzicola mucosus]MBD0416335.1 hypothetical protein [Oryzicola mucosus]
MHQTATGQRKIATLEYVHSMLGQLRMMAEKERCPMLAYYIEMAFIEAGEVVRSESASVQPRKK